MALRLGEMLIQAGKITEKQLEKALEIQGETGAKLGEVLLDLGYISDENVINEFVAKQLNVGTIKLKDLDLSPEIVELIPEDIARKFNVIATIKVGKLLFVATEDPGNILVMDTLKFVTNHNIQPVMASKTAIAETIDKYYGADEESIGDIIETLDSEDDIDIIEEEEDDFMEGELLQAVQKRPLVKLVNGIIMDAIHMKASDVHIETYEDFTRVRYRIDGNLIEKSTLPFRLRHAIVSRIKIMAKLNISERRLPQSGRIKVYIQDNPIDIRVSVMPTIFGEKIGMRLLDPRSLMLDITKLGFPQRGLKEFNKAIHMPFGMILVTGPTGSGKTTTLYSALSQLNTPKKNLMTVEDPVEFNIDGINQVHTKAEIGLTFAAALRSFLRQDPDIILVGEIRDGETASIAIKSALTGHLVFSTLHTNDAPSTVTRLIDMGIPPFLVASSVKLIVSQVLLRKICPQCKTKVEPNQDFLDAIGMTPEDAEKVTFYEGAGCSLCHGTGYKGRTACFEVMPITAKLERMIVNGATNLEIGEQAAKEGLRTLRQEAIRYMVEGITTLEQVVMETSSQ
ncbi:type II secretion system protein GspE [bacterium]|nr:MAG: type II secretion system protein GspE [bacterium]